MASAQRQVYLDLSSKPRFFDPAAGELHDRGFGAERADVLVRIASGIWVRGVLTGPRTRSPVVLPDSCQNDPILGLMTNQQRDLSEPPWPLFRWEQISLGAAFESFHSLSLPIPRSLAQDIEDQEQPGTVLGSLPVGSSFGSLPVGSSFGSLPVGSSFGSLPVGSSLGSLPVGSLGSPTTKALPKRRGRTPGVNKIDNAITALTSRLKDGESVAITAIARQVGCDPKNLKQSRRFMDAYRTLTNANTRTVRHRGAKTEGRLEAWTDPRDDSDDFLDRSPSDRFDDD